MVRAGIFLKESDLRHTSYENLKRALEMKDKQIRQLHLELDTMNEQFKTKVLLIFLLN